MPVAVNKNESYSSTVIQLLILMQQIQTTEYLQETRIRALKFLGEFIRVEVASSTAEAQNDLGIRSCVPLTNVQVRREIASILIALIEFQPQSVEKGEFYLFILIIFFKIYFDLQSFPEVCFFFWEGNFF